MKRIWHIVLIVMLLSITSIGNGYAQNLIVNPDFEDGNTGFVTDYTFAGMGGVDGGFYCIDTTTSGHSLGYWGWPTILGYGGSGKYMLVNGFGQTTNPTKVVWKQTVPVTPNTEYVFSCQVVNLTKSIYGINLNPSILRLTINGATVGSDITLEQNNNWLEWLVAWSNENATEAEIAIYDVYNGDSNLGDDFGLDHLILETQATYNVNDLFADALDIAVYPNPTNGPVKIEAEDLRRITVSNALGQVLYEGKTDGDRFAYDFSQHGEGVYLIRVETASTVVTKRVAVTR